MAEEELARGVGELISQHRARSHWALQSTVRFFPFMVSKMASREGFEQWCDVV